VLSPSCIDIEEVSEPASTPCELITAEPMCLASLIVFPDVLKGVSNAKGHWNLSIDVIGARPGTAMSEALLS
jgi:hypothetical protein